MKRNVFLFFFKSAVALFFLSFSNNGLAIGYTAISSGNFNSISTWGETPTLDSGDDFIIKDNKTITVTTNLILGTLTINSGSTLKITATSDITITIENLVINESGGFDASFFDFGTSNVTVMIKGNLLGDAYSEIIHNPASGKTQHLILQGALNKLYLFRSPFDTPAAGTSLVTYERAGDQTVFNSDQYADLELKGSGIKTLQGPANQGAEATVNNRLTIEGCQLKLPSPYNFNYNGSEANLTCNTGWIMADGNSGRYSSIHGATRTFPIGDANRMRKFQLTNIDGKKISVDFQLTSSIPNSGLGTWYVITQAPVSTQITLLNPGSASLSAASNIALYNGSVWKIQPTTYTSASTAYSTTNNISLSSGTTLFGIFTCPSFTATPASLPDAEVDVNYNQTVQLSGGTGPYDLASSAAPTGYTFTEQATGVTISGKPLNTNPVPVSFTSQDATGCQTPFTFTIIPVVKSTTWNGSSWSNGVPGVTIAAIFTGDYTTGKDETLQAKNITVNAGVTVTLVNQSVLISNNKITNNGTIFQNCRAQVSYDSFSGNTVTQPSIQLSALPYGSLNQPYNQAVKANITATNPVYSMSPATAVPGLVMSNTGLLSGTPTASGSYTFDVSFTEGYCVQTQAYTLSIIEPAAPNLYIYPINTKVFGDADFKLSAYTKNTATPIVYTISPANSCVTLLPGNMLKITCAGPAPNNIITVTAKQAATTAYKAETASTSFFIHPAPAKLKIENIGFLPNVTTPILSEKKSDGVLTFTQLSGQDVATVTSNGTVTTTGITGTFSVLARLAATDNYTGFDSIYEFSSYPVKHAPVAVNDTIVLQMGQDSIFNLLLNDYGLTDPVNPALTDIDLENSGIQNKYYSTGLGTFNIDLTGQLYIRTFEGFAGSGQLEYTITDASGLISGIAYLYITVEPPFKLPDLKANEVMTPNSDNLNDALVIANTDLNKANNLVILDESGNKVYEKINYQNDWEGIDTNNNKVKAGVYFYVFKESNTGRQLSNYIQIVTQ